MFFKCFKFEYLFGNFGDFVGFSFKDVDIDRYLIQKKETKGCAFTEDFLLLSDL